MILKYPPFPNSEVKNTIKLAVNGNKFYAPEIDAGIQSSPVDSWSAGVIEYWMRNDCMPEFKEGLLQIKNQFKMSP